MAAKGKYIIVRRRKDGLPSQSPPMPRDAAIRSAAAAVERGEDPEVTSISVVHSITGTVARTWTIQAGTFGQ